MGCPAAGSETTFASFLEVGHLSAGSSLAPERAGCFIPREPEVSAHDGDGTDEQRSQTESFSAVM